MSTGKARRLKVLGELIRTQSVASQEEMADRLAAAGFRVTQATISRDLEALGAVRIRRPEGVAYALPGEISSTAREQRRLAPILADWVLSVAAAGNLVILRTPPGSAHLVGVALDQARLPRVVGTICGDDTIFVAAATAREAIALAGQLGQLAGSATNRPESAPSA